MADVLGRDLIDRRAQMNIGAGRLLRPAAGEQRCAGPRMIAGAVVAGRGIDVVETGDDLNLILERRRAVPSSARARKSCLRPSATNDPGSRRWES